MGQKWRDLAEIVLKTGRRDDLEDVRRGRPRVPECMRDTTRFEQIGAGADLAILVANARPDRSRQDIAVFIFALVRVRWHERAGRHWVFDDRERAARNVSIELEHDTQP